ncbi:MAG: VWA domain-containing protein [Gaiellaceae bacterium]
MRKLIAIVGCIVCLAAPAAAAAGDAPSIVEARAPFPERTYVLTLPHPAPIVTRSVTVTENGDPVTHLSVVTASAAGRTGTLLVIDASNSMSGKPIAAALAAARGFAARRNPGQDLALMTFNSRANVVLPFTHDGAQIAEAMSQPPRLANGTHIFDAVQAAVALVDAANLRTATIIILSDGADVGSRVTLAQAEASLRSHHVRLFAVGLKSSAFDGGALGRLATAGTGSLSVATTLSSLGPIYDKLGFKLANEYLVQYLSLAKPDRSVRVRVKIAGFDSAADAGYRTPRLLIPVKGPVQVSVAERILRSWELMVGLVFTVVFLVFFAVRRLLAGPAVNVRRRLGEFVSVTREDELRRREEVRTTLQRRRRANSNFRAWTSFAEEAELSGIAIAPSRLALWGVAAALFLGLVTTAIAGPIFGFLAFFAPLVALPLYVRRRLKRWRSTFADQLADNLEVLASALRAGHSLIGGLAVVVDDAAEPSKSEFRRVLADEQLGVPLEDALRVTVKRMANRDLDQVAVIVVLQRDAGANSAEVLDQIVDNIRARQEIRRLIRVLTAQGRMAKWIVSLLPVGLLLAITLINPGYMRPMWHETVGHFFLALAAVMVTTGSILIGRIIDIDV